LCTSEVSIGEVSKSISIKNVRCNTIGEDNVRSVLHRFCHIRLFLFYWDFLQ